MREIAVAGGRVRPPAREGIDPDELPALTDYASAQRWLEVVARGVATHRVSAREGGAITRALEVWLRGEAERLTGEVVTKLRAKVADLQRELRKRGRS